MKILNKDLINDYDEISSYCHNSKEAVIISNNGKNDLVVMSIDTYNELIARYELYAKLSEGMDDVEAGHVKPLSQSIASIKEQLKK